MAIKCICLSYLLKRLKNETNNKLKYTVHVAWQSFTIINSIFLKINVYHVYNVTHPLVSQVVSLHHQQGKDSEHTHSHAGKNTLLVWQAVQLADDEGL